MKKIIALALVVFGVLSVLGAAVPAGLNLFPSEAKFTVVDKKGNEFKLGADINGVYEVLGKPGKVESSGDYTVSSYKSGIAFLSRKSDGLVESITVTKKGFTLGEAGFQVGKSTLEDVYTDYKNGLYKLFMEGRKLGIGFYSDLTVYGINGPSKVPYFDKESRFYKNAFMYVDFVFDGKNKKCESFKIYCLFEDLKSLSAEKGSFPSVELISLYDGNGNIFRAGESYEGVTEVLGEPDSVNTGTLYPPEKDKYNQVVSVYDSGVTFTYRKGFGRVERIITEKGGFKVRDKIIGVGSDFNTIYDLYCSGLVGVSFAGKDLSVTFGTGDEEFIPPEVENPEDYSIFVDFVFDYETQKCKRIILSCETGV